eukprot:CAMPEP_0182871934 /NCGR_PEP_ID=MMETSP0034_2-20130328/11412_1 /TAXON_ID=156128 /ORGANISM="Nephroselmis pyriformis, Strain CCMP717" /LENGTH=106 /DNA_ID=CAMNT_0025004505 /DNA_START=1 /DNA_END=322 /DNA_ORIENTATION=+
MQGGGGGAPNLGGPIPSLDLTKISYAAMGGDAEPMPKQEVQDSDTSEPRAQREREGGVSGVGICVGCRCLAGAALTGPGVALEALSSRTHGEAAAGAWRKRLRAVA